MERGAAGGMERGAAGGMERGAAGAETAALLRRLCAALAPQDRGAYELALSYLSSAESTRGTSTDEPLLCQRIRSRLTRVTGAREADKFDDCYQKMKNSVVLKQRASVLALLYALSPAAPGEASLFSPVTHQLFPVPILAPPTPSPVPPLPKAAGSDVNMSNPSKSTLGSASWCSAGAQPLLQRASTCSITPLGTHHPNTTEGGRWLARAGEGCERDLVRGALLGATGVRRAVSGPRPAVALHARATHLGTLHDRLKEFTDPASGLMPHGLMGEGLVSALREELTEYYRSVALLQAQAGEAGGTGGGATLRRVCLWAQEPLHRLTWLASITHAAHHRKGGELASCVHRFVGHGDERVASLARRLLTALTYPLLLMLTRWLLHGEIDDPFNEFFIESRSGVPIDRMWHDKYRVREWMVPSFMSREQAAQILATGKSVVFMREACADEPPDAAHMQHLKTLLHPPTDGEREGAWWEQGGLRCALAAAHEAASRRLLLALTHHHHLLDHLLAHRRYLLLAQGDFVHHLMTLLQEELCKPAAALYVHNLTCTLEAAVRATNAQYEPPHVLARLHVNLFPSQPLDSGWDVFALQYRVDGPLGTLFPATCAARYRALFTQLWRVKRIEYALHTAWRAHHILHKRLKHIPEVEQLMRRVSCVRAEALRVCGALQEVGCVGAAEAAWQELLAAVRAARSLDHLLHTHQAFLERAAIDAMIHHTTKELQSYLGNVLEEVLTLGTFEATLRAGLTAELQRRDAITALRAERTARGEYATTAVEEAAEKERRKEFQQYLASRKADLNVLARSYRGHVKALILKLALHAETSLQTLAFRLDYNDFYKRGDSKLHEPLTYQHKRLSEIRLQPRQNNKMSEKPLDRALRRK